jgi:hypothetical protein
MSNRKLQFQYSIRNSNGRGTTTSEQVQSSVDGAFRFCLALPYINISPIVFSEALAGSKPFADAYMANASYTDFIGFWIKCSEGTPRVPIILSRQSRIDIRRKTWTFSHCVDFYGMPTEYSANGGLGNFLRYFANIFLIMERLTDAGLHVDAELHLNDNLRHYKFYPAAFVPDILLELALELYDVSLDSHAASAVKILADRYHINRGFASVSLPLLDLAVQLAARTPGRIQKSAFRHVAVKATP